jgi:L-alanine-DL-glutamate epimerase-like enolase superfamily enzyme
MQIKSIETFASKMLCFVRVTDEGGARGWGMAAPFTADITAQVIHRLAAGTAIQEYERFTDVADAVMNEQYKHLGSYLARAAGGIDTALWDLEAKKANKPVAELVGQRRSVIDLYASSMQRDKPVEYEANRMRALQDKYGYRALKLHPGIPVGFDRDYWPGRTEDMVREMMRKAAPGSEVYVDVNGNYSVEKAVEAAAFLKEQGVAFFEEPCPYWELDKTKAVREACAEIGIPVAGGEQDYVEPVWDKIINERVVDICQPDLLYIGGFTRALRIAGKAAKADLAVTPHTSNRSPIFVMGLHYMACIEKPYHFMECGIEDDAWALDSYVPQIKIQDGRASVPQGPGWGFEPSAEFLAKAEYAVTVA